MIRAGWTAAASACALARVAGARTGEEGRSAVPPELQTLIAPERSNILGTLASEDIPGAAICLINEGKAWTEGFGVTDRVSNRRVSAGTIFSIQSTSKNLTATAIMLAVQRGFLDLDRPITSYVPEFTVQSRFQLAWVEAAPQENPRQ
jgi:CubicO group peptidase (beta-lactamase class C family)